MIMMLGLQGAGKTTTAAKLAKLLTEKEGKKVLMASLDGSVRRRRSSSPFGTADRRHDAADRAGAIACGNARRALVDGRAEGFDVVISDTAGRLAIDDALMDERRRCATLLRRMKAFWSSMR